MNYKTRAYIAFTTSINTNSEINLETFYNNTKSSDEKISDSTVSGSVGFKNIIFWYDADVKVKTNAVSESHNDFITFKKVNNQITQNSISFCKEVVFRNDSGGTLALSVYAIPNKSNKIIN